MLLKAADAWPGGSTVGSGQGQPWKAGVPHTGAANTLFQPTSALQQMGPVMPTFALFK